MDTTKVLEYFEEDAYKVPLGAQGQLLPNIKAWNNVIKFLEKGISPGWIFRGSIDDLADSECPSCNKQMIRVGTRFNDVFRAGVIQCEYAGRKNLPQHPTEYWAEVWQDANFPENTTDRWNLGDETPAEVANRFKFSDPRIKKCFQIGTLEFYPYEVRLWEDWYRTNKPGERFEPKPLPEADFVHKK